MTNQGFLAGIVILAALQPSPLVGQPRETNAPCVAVWGAPSHDGGIGVPRDGGTCQETAASLEPTIPLRHIAAMVSNQTTRDQEKDPTSVAETHRISTGAHTSDGLVVPLEGKVPDNTMSDQRHGAANNPGKLALLLITACVTLTGWMGMWLLVSLVLVPRLKRVEETKSLHEPMSATGRQRSSLQLNHGDDLPSTANSSADHTEVDTEEQLTPLFTELAENYLSDQDQFRLAFTFQKNGSRPIVIDKKQRARFQRVSLAQRVKAARKLDIGLGELEIAVRLSQLQHSQSKREEFA